MPISGNYRIDALLQGADARWNSRLAFGTPTEITYGFMNALPAYYTPSLMQQIYFQGDPSTFTTLDSAHRDLVRQEFAQLSNAISGLRFTEVSDPSAAVILVGTRTYDVAAAGDAMGYAPNGASTTGDLNASGDVWFNLNSEKYDISRTMLWNSVDMNAAFGGTIPSSYLQYVGGTLPVGIIQFEDMTIHEIGHALGLKHPGNSANYGVYGGAGTGSNVPPYLPANEDDSLNTMMSYNGNYAGPEPRSYDIAALGFLYGATPPSDGRWLLATGGSSVILGSSLNELIWPGQGAHSIDGGGGQDVMRYDSARSTYSLTKTASSYTISGSEGTDTLTNMERLSFADGTLGLDTSGTSGQMYRLYKAAFDRVPDPPGLGHNIRLVDAGMTLAQMSAAFVASAEFTNTYGALSNAQFINQLYLNVLDRTPDAAGLAHNLNLLNTTLTRANMLAAYSESTENQLAVIGQIQDGIWFT